jgi:hypothetical protein
VHRDSQSGGFGANFALSTLNATSGAPVTTFPLPPSIGALSTSCFAFGAGIVATCTTRDVIPDCLAFLDPVTAELKYNVCNKDLVINAVNWDEIGQQWLVGGVNASSSDQVTAVFFLPLNARSITAVTRRVYVHAYVDGGIAAFNSATRTLTLTAGQSGTASLINLNVLTGSVSPPVKVTRANIELLTVNGNTDGMLAWADTVTLATLQGVDVVTGKTQGIVLAALKATSPLSGAAASNGIHIASALLTCATHCACWEWERICVSWRRRQRPYSHRAQW